LPLDAKPPKPIQRVLSHFVFQAGFSIQADEVDTVRKQPDWVVIDSRAENRFIGDQEVIDISGGHIPGARHLPYTMVFNQDGYYKSPDELRALYHPYVGGIQPDHCVFYCGSGVTSVVHLIALEHAGFAGVKLFSGSWSEWIRDPKHEIAVK
jgi:thiosulfate/3-mercaptopyruvate sulfurtransferase